jgi:hypothetical protein
LIRRFQRRWKAPTRIKSASLAKSKREETMEDIPEAAKHAIFVSAGEAVRDFLVLSIERRVRHRDMPGIEGIAKS